MSEPSHPTPPRPADFHPKVRQLADTVVRHAYATCEAVVRFTEIHRPLARQRWLHESGRERKGPILTSLTFGWHNCPPGEVRAGDFFFLNWRDFANPVAQPVALPAPGAGAWGEAHAWSLYQPWGAVGIAVEALGGRWGGRWGDYGHFEFPLGMKLREARERWGDG